MADIKKENIYVKLEKARSLFLKSGVKKSGKNTFSKYEYFELDDIVPPKTEIFNTLGLCDIVTYTEETATLTLVNTDIPEETLVFTSPMRTLELKGANAVQLLGGVETYLRRYLYMAMLDIVEHDQFDVQPAPQTPPQGKLPGANETNDFPSEVRAFVASLSQQDRKTAGEIVKSMNHGSAEFWTITDAATQANIMKALKEKFNG